MSRIRVAHVIDRDDWVLGSISAAIAEVCTDAHVDIVRVRSADFYEMPIGTLRLLASCQLVHWLSPHSWLRFGALLPRAAHVCSIHHVLPHDELWPARFRETYLLTGSLHTAGRMVERGFDAPRIAHYGVDSALFVPMEVPAARNELDLDPVTPHVGWFAKYSSNQADRKGTQHLVAALEAVNRQRRVDVLLTGEGWSALTAELAEHGVVAHHRPAVGLDQMPVRYGALDCYLCTSQVEGGPLPVLEAMASERLVISTPVGHCAEVIVPGETGFLTNGADHTAELILTSVGGSEARRIAARARQVVASEWTWQTGQGELASVYREVLEGFTPRRRFMRRGVALLALSGRVARHRRVLLAGGR